MTSGQPAVTSPAAVDMKLGRSKFETELQVRPDDIDMNRHVHASRYLDYVLAARFDQMARCYMMSMEEFMQAGLGWYVRTAHLEFKRPLDLGDHFIVRTWVEEFLKDGFQHIDSDVLLLELILDFGVEDVFPIL